MAGLGSYYPVTIKWSDDTETTFASEGDHARRIAVCKHADGFFNAAHSQWYGCWKCLSTPLWDRRYT